MDHSVPVRFGQVFSHIALAAADVAHPSLFHLRLRKIGEWRAAEITFPISWLDGSHAVR